MQSSCGRHVHAPVSGLTMVVITQAPVVSKKPFSYFFGLLFAYVQEAPILRVCQVMYSCPTPAYHHPSQSEEEFAMNLSDTSPPSSPIQTRGFEEEKRRVCYKVRHPISHMPNMRNQEEGIDRCPRQVGFSVFRVYQWKSAGPCAFGSGSTNCS